MNAIQIKPEDMGTTGLVAYVLDIRRDSNGHKCRYNRIRKAFSVIRARHGKQAFVPFCKAIWASVGTNVHMQRHFSDLLANYGFVVPQ